LPRLSAWRRAGRCPEHGHVGEDGYLLPVGRNQPPPDLKYFDLPQK
jgi:hypothetical protein